MVVVRPTSTNDTHAFRWPAPPPRRLPHLTPVHVWINQRKRKYRAHRTQQHVLRHTWCTFENILLLLGLIVGSLIIWLRYTDAQARRRRLRGEEALI